MRRSFLLFYVVLFSTNTYAQVYDYVSSFRNNEISNYSKEQAIIQRYSAIEILDSLSSCYTDSVIQVRQKAFYLTHKVGIQSDAANQTQVVHCLLNGCNDPNGSIIGQCLQYLQNYSKETFDIQARNQINNLLQKKQQPHLKKLILLSGYVGAGNEVMQRKLLLPDKESPEVLWAINLAQARMGNQESLLFCITKAQSLPIGNEMVTWLIPEMIYTRQKEAIDFCITILNCEDALCFSSNPDHTKKILCGYRVLELLAPVIKEFPIQTDASGSLITSDYNHALYQGRKWFTEHADYKIVADNY